jgi:peptidoglycan/xylan/chitin deacetylase (PgdA/CDA1 family)
MTIRTDWLAAIKNAKDAGLDGLAYALIVMHDQAFPSEQLKPLYDRMVLANLNRHRQLVEIAPSFQTKGRVS